MKLTTLCTVVALAALAATGSSAPKPKKVKAPKFDTHPFEFDADKENRAFADWLKGVGEPDFKGKSNEGLLLDKNADLEEPVAAGAELKHLDKVVVQAGDVVGYDLRDGSPVEAGSPRFNISWTDANGTEGFSFVGGAANGYEESAPTPGWTRFVFPLQDPATAFPPVPVGAKIDEVILIVDDPGVYVLDNIRYNEQFADKQGESSPEP